MKRTTVVFLLLCAALFFGCAAKESKAAPGSRSGQDKPFSVLVYITGVTAGSPSYEMLAAGAKEFADEHGDSVRVTVYEAGFNQAEWEEQLTSLVSGGEYDLTLGSNPSLPEICANVAKQFPDHRFIITDAWLEGSPQISTWLYNQYEQALFLGYLAGLVTASDMPRANAGRRIGFIAAQEYPLLNRHIVPGFLDGARRADPSIELDFRVIGNWYDANKAADLASSMVDAGVDVFASIAGGAAQGMIRILKDRGAYAVAFNTNEYSQAPGLIVGCGLMEQKKLVTEILAGALAGNIQYGTARIVGAADGYLNFIADDPGYRDYVPADMQRQYDAFMNDIRAGRVAYTVPPL
jgi:simple sugar transport system substrate-binding protein